LEGAVLQSEIVEEASLIDHRQRGGAPREVGDDFIWFHDDSHRSVHAHRELALESCGCLQQTVNIEMAGVADRNWPATDLNDMKSRVVLF
jgi:hypothetical protein